MKFRESMNRLKFAYHTGRLAALAEVNLNTGLLIAKARYEREGCVSDKLFNSIVSDHRNLLKDENRFLVEYGQMNWFERIAYKRGKKNPYGEDGLDVVKTF